MPIIPNIDVQVRNLDACNRPGEPEHAACRQWDLPRHGAPRPRNLLACLPSARRRAAAGGRLLARPARHPSPASLGRASICGIVASSTRGAKHHTFLCAIRIPPPVPTWNLTAGPPRTTAEPIWAETPKLSAVGKIAVFWRPALELRLDWRALGGGSRRRSGR